ncbi:hypothetical protein BH10PLA1_BH10PLA1_05410 [soil metagenome]
MDAIFELVFAIVFSVWRCTVANPKRSILSHPYQSQRRAVKGDK